MSDLSFRRILLSCSAVAPHVVVQQRLFCRRKTRAKLSKKQNKQCVSHLSKDFTRSRDFTFGCPDSARGKQHLAAAGRHCCASKSTIFLSVHLLEQMLQNIFSDNIGPCARKCSHPVLPSYFVEISLQKAHVNLQHAAEEPVRVFPRTWSRALCIACS